VDQFATDIAGAVKDSGSGCASGSGVGSSGSVPVLDLREI
jgi:hypothetical protein